MSGTIVSELMTAAPQTVLAEDPLVRAYDIMSSLHCRHVPVVNGDGGLVGMVSERDLLARALDRQDGSTTLSIRSQLENQTVETVMVTGIEAAYPDDPISEAAQKMFENKFGCLPVIEGGRLVGILTEGDFVRRVATGGGR
jgi:CBS domain-containing protein